MSDVVRYTHVQGGNVPGGHRVIYDGRKPFITPMRECNSIALRHSDVVVDVGAYVGTYAIRCARHPVRRVVAYEPTPASYGILSMTRLPNLEVVNAAVVGDDRRSVDLFVSRGIGVTNSIALTSRKSHSVAVPAVNYVDAVRGASVVKIDIEGAEYGLPIIQPHLRALIIDFHPVPGLDWVARAESLIADMVAAGFETVIAPKWENGWTCAGSWLRPRDTAGECEVLMRGEACCGCGTPVTATSRALCPACFGQWSRRHRTGFARAEVSP